MKALNRLFSHLFFQGRFLTTKHRWLNTIILAQLKIITHVPISKEVDRPIFIIGMGRTGSTVLGKVLSFHKEIGFLNEPKAIWYTIDPSEDVNGHFSTAPAKYIYTEKDATGTVVQRAQSLFSFYQTTTHSARVLDKNPEIVFRVPFVNLLFPNAKFIFLTRNGWDTIHSVKIWSEKNRIQNNGQIEDWWGLNQRKWKLMLAELLPQESLLADNRETILAFTQQEYMAATEWIISMQAGLRVYHENPGKVFIIRYEDLTREPSDTLKKLVEFCELSSDEKFFWYAQQQLKPNPERKQIELPSALIGPFMRTMNDLGYNS